MLLVLFCLFFLIDIIIPFWQVSIDSPLCVVSGQLNFQGLFCSLVSCGGHLIGFSPVLLWMMLWAGASNWTVGRGGHAECCAVPDRSVCYAWPEVHTTNASILSNSSYFCLPFWSLHSVADSNSSGQKVLINNVMKMKGIEVVMKMSYRNVHLARRESAKQNWWIGLIPGHSHRQSEHVQRRRQHNCC